jgi:hypothetical protein
MSMEEGKPEEINYVGLVIGIGAGLAMALLAAAIGLALIGSTLPQCADACGAAGVSSFTSGCGGTCVCKKIDQP